MDILDILSEYPWFPVEKPNNILKPKTEYTKLKRANELILFNDLKIAGGYYHVLDRRVKLGKKDENREYSLKDMAEELGIITNIPDKSIFKSFRELMKLDPRNKQVANYANEFYKYLGRRLKNKITEFNIEERTILINNQWVAPKYVYQYQINLIGIYSWINLVGNDTESNLAKGLI
ncbi:MAG: hypothetical protein KAU90_00045, partial [Sulfurovaceae bacterium]|nr:hypothetical protein [Sulfurovaceae bacterium]